MASFWLLKCSIVSVGVQENFNDNDHIMLDDFFYKNILNRKNIVMGKYNTI